MNKQKVKPINREEKASETKNWVDRINGDCLQFRQVSEVREGNKSTHIEVNYRGPRESKQGCKT